MNPRNRDLGLSALLVAGVLVAAGQSLLPASCFYTKSPASTSADTTFGRHVTKTKGFGWTLYHSRPVMGSALAPTASVDVSELPHSITGVAEYLTQSTEQSVPLVDALDLLQ